MRRSLVPMLATGLLLAALAIPLAALPALAKGPAQKGYAGFTCQPPRFQIFEAPQPYGGLIMLDSKTGESWQRIIVNTPAGIQIRWMKLHQGGPKTGETILWQ